MHSVDLKEIQNFSKDSGFWWDENGPFKPLHKLNPVRIAYIKERICQHFDLPMESLKNLKGLKILDVGCGGGLVCEPMARLGAKVTGIDADKQAILVATAHAKESGLDISYQATSTDKIKEKYDVVLALEIIEHVNDPASFTTECLSLCRPGGLVIFSTLNRTAKSYAFGILAAEHILGWVPKGTHSWKKFVKPSELGSYVRMNNASIVDITGLTYSPVSGQFDLSKSDVDINYFMAATQT